MVTDTNRKQAFRWDTLTANAGYTETPSENPAKSDLSDSPIELFPGTGITSKSYASYIGAVNVTASSYGNPVSFTPENQAYSAIDGNFDTAWVVGTFVSDPKGQWWQVGFANPVTTDHITVVQPQRGDRSRWVSDVTLTFDGKDPIRYQLNACVARDGRPDADVPLPHVPHAPGDDRRHHERHARRRPRPPPSASRRSRSPASRCTRPSRCRPRCCRPSAARRRPTGSPW